MTERDYSNLDRAQILEILSQLQRILEGRNGTLPGTAAIHAPSKLESALTVQQARRRNEPPRERIASRARTICGASMESPIIFSAK